MWEMAVPAILVYLVFERMRHYEAHKTLANGYHAMNKVANNLDEKMKELEERMEKAHNAVQANQIKFWCEQNERNLPIIVLADQIKYWREKHGANNAVTNQRIDKHADRLTKVEQMIVSMGEHMVAKNALERARNTHCNDVIIPSTPEQEEAEDLFYKEAEKLAEEEKKAEVIKMTQEEFESIWLNTSLEKANGRKINLHNDRSSDGADTV